MSEPKQRQSVLRGRCILGEKRLFLSPTDDNKSFSEQPGYGDCKINYLSSIAAQQQMLSKWCVFNNPLHYGPGLEQNTERAFYTTFKVSLLAYIIQELSNYDTIYPPYVQLHGAST